MRKLLILILAASVLASGCLDSDTGGDTEPEDGTDGTTDDANQTGDGPTVTPGTGTTGPGVGTPVVTGGTSVPVEFSVQANATLLYAEIRWDDPVQDIDLTLSDPDEDDMSWTHRATGGSSGSPDSPHTLTIENPKAGGWSASATSGQGATPQVEWELVVSVFYGNTTLPEGYTGFDS